MMNKKDNKIYAKSKNTNSIRVLYKKVGKDPEIKIIPNVFILKKAIVKKQLNIIPYEGAYIICNNNSFNDFMRANIILPLRTIKGDFIIINIDKNERELKSLSQEDIIWFTQNLINKMPPSFHLNLKKNYVLSAYSKTFDNDKRYISFEKTLIDVLISLQSVLYDILKNKKNGDIKNE